ncbi:hypothetical protein MBLNU457_g0476t1 [Dothideomycetes sp. NU457]
MAYYKKEGSPRQLSAHHDLLSACSKIFSEALQAGAATITVNVENAWVLQTFQQWLYFGDWKWPCDWMRDHLWSEQPHEHDDDCFTISPTQAEIVEVISFANDYEILDMLTEASELLCEQLNSGEGVDDRAIFVAQEKLCRFSPVFKVLAEAYAACGTAEDGLEPQFLYPGLKPSFMRAALFEVSEIRVERQQARERKGKERRCYNFRVENCRPVHNKDYYPDKDDVVETTMNKEAI